MGPRPVLATTLNPCPTAERYSLRARHGDGEAENILLHGDNVDALAWLRERFLRRFACVYIDPPFNTGRTFAEYKDDLDPGLWLSMMQPRLEAMVPLLRDDGVIIVEIDDTMVGELTRLMDDIFGRDQRISTITVVRSASTGHKAKNRGPVNVTDFLLVYEKMRGAWRYRPQIRIRETYDSAYRTWVEGVDGPHGDWKFEPLARQVARTLGFASSLAAKRSLGPTELGRRVAEYALAHPHAVARFAQPRFEAVSRRAQELILRSRAAPQQVFRLERPGLPDMLLRAGNRILFLASKVRPIGGRSRIVEPLTNVWDDLGFQGIAKEGGVVFSRNKKPERLLARVIAMTTDPGDWVLDAFVGSGTTAAVAHKMGRRWVGIEKGDQLWDLCVPRLRRVVDGLDNGGVTSEYDWRGGGGFAVYA
jgi:adenine-specific DNA-methyltransferase